MGTEKEEIPAPAAVGIAVVNRAYRHASGRWSVEFDLNFRVPVGDGRVLYVRKMLRVAVTEQRGRKPRSDKKPESRDAKIV